MAFEIKLGTKKITNPTGDRIYLMDKTGTIGDITYEEDPANDSVYLSKVNDTGYGTPNATRDSMALKIVGVLKKTKGDTYVDFVSYDPVTATEFAAKILEDGWYQFHVVSLPLVVPTINGDAYYDTLTGKVYQLLLDVLVETDPKDLINGKYKVHVHQQFFVANTSFKKTHYNSKISDLILCNHNGCNDKDIHRLRLTYNELRAVLQSAVYEYCRGNKAVAQKNIEYLNCNVDDLLF